MPPETSMVPPSGPRAASTVPSLTFRASIFSAPPLLVVMSPVTSRVAVVRGDQGRGAWSPGA